MICFFIGWLKGEGPHLRGSAASPAEDQPAPDRGGAVEGLFKIGRGDHRAFAPWQQLIKTYDKPGTLFFLDPPYYKAPYYAHNFELNDYSELADVLSRIKSHFIILSINDHPQMRDAFKGFVIKPVKLSYSAAKDACTRVQELLITM